MLPSLPASPAACQAQCIVQLPSCTSAGAAATCRTRPPVDLLAESPRVPHSTPDLIMHMQVKPLQYPNCDVPPDHNPEINHKCTFDEEQAMAPCPLPSAGAQTATTISLGLA